MPTDDLRTGLLLRQALHATPDPPVDLRAARGRLQQRTRAVARRRRLAVLAVAAVLVVTAVLLADSARTGDHDAVPARLPSGLPVGSLNGTVYYTDPTHGYDGQAAFFVHVGADGTGTYTPPRSNGGNIGGGSEWPVRFVGRRPGHVVILREDARCGETADLTLDFTVDGDTVTVTAGTIGPCSVWPTIAPTRLAGATLTWQEPSGGS
jgi:hypothetical protein